MSESIGTRLKHAWDVFRSRDPTYYRSGGSNSRQDRRRAFVTNERSIIASVYNRIALDVASINIRHVRLDDNDMFKEEMSSGLNDILKVEANIDQASRPFIQDIAMSMFDEGVIAVVPTRTNIDPAISTSYEIGAMRVGKITEWFPKEVRIKLYNEDKGIQEEIVLSKSMVAIIENPLYAVMNEPNSTLKRLLRKLSMLDAVDEQSASGKLDLIIQLPYVIKSALRKEQAEKRRKDLEEQLAGSKYGIGYTDGTERVIQLNRPAENNLMAQVQYLTAMFFNQLGLTEGVFDGTADEPTMLNYINRTIVPMLNAITEEFERKFLTKTARTQKQAIKYFRDVFSLVSVNEIANIADKLTRNEIVTSNEIRGVIGFKPSDDPGANELRNKNISQSKQVVEPVKDETQNESDSEKENSKNE